MPELATTTTPARARIGNENRRCGRSTGSVKRPANASRFMSDDTYSPVVVQE